MKSINRFVIVFSIALLASCDFGDTNVNPALPSDVSAQAITPAAQAGLAFAIGGEMVRISGLFMQQFQGINAQQFDNYKYLVKASDMDGVWRRMYASALNPLVTILRKAESVNSNHTAGMAKVLIALGIGHLTDMFGDIPYSDAWEGLDDNFFPTYDTQEAIYGSIHSLLDEAISQLSGDAGSGPALAGDDLMYGGNTDAWIKAAQALKAKYYLHTCKVDNQAYSKALSALENGFSSNADDLQFNFGSNTNEANPQYQFTQDRGGNINIDPYFFNLLIDLNDPRSPAFLSPASTDSGFNTNFNSGTFYTTINSPVIYVSYAEQKFIEAEAKLMGSGDVEGAQAALAEAIRASLEKIVGTADDAYVAQHSDLSGLADQQAQLAQIIGQKYIAMYSHGLQVWTDYRRTGFPDIPPVEGGNNAFNNNGEIPRRLPYPQTEIDLNQSNVPISAPDFQQRFWWDL